MGVSKVLGQHYLQWFHTAEDVLFSIEFLVVQLFLIYHLVRALFFSQKRVPRRGRRVTNRPGLEKEHAN
jgi:hypothetical protein